LLQGTCGQSPSFAQDRVQVGGQGPSFCLHSGAAASHSESLEQISPMRRGGILTIAAASELPTVAETKHSPLSSAVMVAEFPVETSEALPVSQASAQFTGLLLPLTCAVTVAVC
jgi:hypothetical protein